MSSTETAQDLSRPAGSSGFTNVFGRIFGNFKVRTKILAGFASVLVILIGVSGLGYSNFVFVGHEIDILAEDIEKVRDSYRITQIDLGCFSSLKRDNIVKFAGFLSS